MGLYGEHVLPRIVNVACAGKKARPLRSRVCAGLHGEVVELGFGSGLNVPFYPGAVTRVAAVEPADVGWKLAEKRVSASRVPVERSGLDGQSLPFEDDTFDSALSTWTLCRRRSPRSACSWWAVPDRYTERARELIVAHEAVADVPSLPAIYLGPRDVLVTGEVRLHDGLHGDDVVDAPDRIRGSITARYPQVSHWYLTPIK